MVPLTGCKLTASHAERGGLQELQLLDCRHRAPREHRNGGAAVQAVRACRPEEAMSAWTRHCAACLPLLGRRVAAAAPPLAGARRGWRPSGARRTHKQQVLQRPHRPTEIGERWRSCPDSARRRCWTCTRRGWRTGSASAPRRPPRLWLCRSTRSTPATDADGYITSVALCFCIAIGCCVDASRALEHWSKGLQQCCPCCRTFLTGIHVALLLYCCGTGVDERLVLLYAMFTSQSSACLHRRLR